MSKFLNKLFIVIIFLMFLFPVFVQAGDINMNLTNNVNTSNSTSNVTGAVSNTADVLANNTNRSSVDASVTSSLNSLPEANLGFTNILSIILIVIGILLLLLGVAILIRLKH